MEKLWNIQSIQYPVCERDGEERGYDVHWSLLNCDVGHDVFCIRCCLGHRGLKSVSLHPGVIKSGLQQFLTDDFIATKTFDKNMEQGAATQVLLAVMPHEELYPGGYYVDCNLHQDMLRKDLQPVYGYFGEGFDAAETMEYKLWEISEKLISEKSFSFESIASVQPHKMEL